MKFKKLIYLFMFVFMISLCYANVNYTSLTANGYSSLPLNEIGYNLNQIPTFTATFTNDSNVYIYCTDAESKFNTCRKINTTVSDLTDCINYNEANSSSPLTTTTNLQYETRGDYTIYCQLCTQYGVCDNSTLTGNNYITFRVAGITTVQRTIFPVAIIVYLAVLIALGNKYVKTISNKKKLREKIEQLFIAGVIGCLVMVVIYTAML